jgi:hypothetical protein
MQIDMATVTNFGSGTMQVTLPVLPDSLSALSFTGIIDLAGGQSGNVFQIFGQTLEGSATVRLYTAGSNGLRTGVTGSAPGTLTTSSRIYISGSYIAASAS